MGAFSVGIQGNRKGK